MCSDQQHEETIHTLKIIQSLLEARVTGRPPIEQIHNISATVPYVVAYKNRKHIWVYTANALTLSLEDIGTATLAANTWTNISFITGMRIFATNTATNLPIFVRCTDESAP